MIADFVLQHWYCFTLPLGAVSLAGAVFNWNWLCAPASKADAERYTRGTRRLIFTLYRGFCCSLLAFGAL